MTGDSQREHLEEAACTPQQLDLQGFTSNFQIPYGVTADHIQAALEQFRRFLGTINEGLNAEGLARLESMLMPANFSSLVGEFMLETLEVIPTTQRRRLRRIAGIMKSRGGQP